MKGMNFEEWQALMRTQRNGGTSSEIHNHEAVISNKNPNSESGNAAADEFRAKQRYHNEQSKGMATDRKEEVAPPAGAVYELRGATIENQGGTSRQLENCIVADGSFLYVTAVGGSKSLINWSGDAQSFDKNLVSGKQLVSLFGEGLVNTNVFVSITSPSPAALRNLGEVDTAVLPV